MTVKQPDDTALHTNSLKARSLQRVIVVGTSGSGKTTFAQQLAQQLKVPHVELDALYWQPQWTPTPKEEFKGLVAQAAVTSDAWVMDGNYSAVRQHLWGRATALIWLNYPFHIVMSRALRRTCRRILSRQVLWPEHSSNRESFRKSFLSRESILWWVVTTYQKRRREYPQLFKEPQYQHLQIVILTSPQAAERFFQSIQ